MIPRWVPALALLGACAGAGGGGPATPGTGAAAVPPEGAPYRLLAGAESDDQVALIEFTPCARPGAAGCGARLVRTYPVGLTPSDIEGPHGVVATPDGAAFFVSIAHGRPFGYLQKFDLASGRLMAQVELGMFPATVALGPGGFVYAINFNFEDPEMRPSSLSVVDGGSMIEVARVTTCRMPHGSRLSPDGARHYSGCMMDDLLVEVDTRTMSVARLLRLTPGAEGPVAVAAAASEGEHAGHTPMESACSPTWAEPSADGTKVYVACNRSGEIVEVDIAAWRVTRRWPTPKAPYNLAATPDGKLLVATQKGPGTTTVWRLADAALLGEVPGTRKVASGVAVSADSRFAFVTLEGIGGEPGTVDVIDLRAVGKVGTIDIGKQAGGIALVP